MLNQGASATKLYKQVDKVMIKHPEAFDTFDKIANNIKLDIQNLNN